MTGLSFPEYRHERKAPAVVCNTLKSENFKLFSKIFKIVILALLMVFLIRGVISLLKIAISRFRLPRIGNKAIGTITINKHYKQTLLSDSGEIPVIEFETNNNTKIIGEPFNSIRAYPNLYKQGQTYSIYYNHSNPQHFIIIKWTEDILLILLLFTSISLLTGLIYGVIQLMD